MSPIFKFRVRSAARNRETDLGRFNRLEALFDKIASEMAAEKAGLEARYRSSQTNAGFLFDTMENEGDSMDSPPQLNSLSADIIGCEKRLAELGRQMAVIAKVRSDLGQLLQSPDQA